MFNPIPAKVLLEHNYAILSSFEIVVIFNNTSADLVLISWKKKIVNFGNRKK